ncbi:MAG TPA: aconitate hydratase AcnA [Armatimonadetes bacterium]|nr:aconitate hydratase AcnA [Armatimonadota bacterium]
MNDSFGVRRTLTLGGTEYQIASLPALGDLRRMPYSLRVVLESLLRLEDGLNVTPAQIQSMLDWRPDAPPQGEIAFTSGRVLLQDFTGVPAVVDLAAMRDAMAALGGDPQRINPLVPCELVIDHSVQVDSFGGADSLAANIEREYERNHERYAFLRWGQTAFDNFRVVPPGQGICHQVNLEHLSRVVMTGRDRQGVLWAYPDSLVGTDSHTTMVNGLGVLGWGVGGIEAEAALLGQPMSMLVPEVVGVRLTGALQPGATGTDLVLLVTQQLRQLGVVGKFVEYFGPSVRHLTIAERAVVSNMSPEYGATCGFFPVDAVSLAYLAFTGRPAEQIALVEGYLREQQLFVDESSPEPEFTTVLELDLSTVEPSMAGPRRPQDRLALADVRDSFAPMAPTPPHQASTELAGEEVTLTDGMVVITAITSCTNTSNPALMLGAGLLAKKAIERGLQRQPWVKSSLAPGSQVVTDYLAAAGLQTYLDQLGFNLVGYGCTTCIGNSGPLLPAVSQAITDGDLVVASVLSGNRNFEGRIHAEVKANYLASPLLVVAYSLVGRIDVDLSRDPLGHDPQGNPVYLADIWPSQEEVATAIGGALSPEAFAARYADVFTGDQRWEQLASPEGDLYVWQSESTYVKHPPYFDGLTREPSPTPSLSGLRVLAKLGDSVTTDHISPAGAIARSSPAGRYLLERGVTVPDFNSYGSRRGNHEVMARGTFANIRLRNLLCPGTEGGVTRHLPSGEQMSIYDAAERYIAEGTGLLILTGREYGSGSSRDWAAKGPKLLGVRAVLAESYERIHRSNLVGMGIVPLQYLDGESAETLNLSGEETYTIGEVGAGAKEVEITAVGIDGSIKTFRARVRIDTPAEVEYYRHGGILEYVLRSLLD